MAEITLTFSTRGSITVTLIEPCGRRTDLYNGPSVTEAFDALHRCREGMGI